MKVRFPDGRVVSARIEEYFEIPMLLVGDEEFGTSDVAGWDLVEATTGERDRLAEAGYAFGLGLPHGFPRGAPGGRPPGDLPEVNHADGVLRCGRLMGRRLVDEEGRDFVRVAIELSRFRRSGWLELEAEELDRLEALLHALRAATPEEVL
jgi:hypothetical protein